VRESIAEIEITPQIKEGVTRIPVGVK